MIDSKDQAEEAIKQIVEWIKREPTHAYRFNREELESDHVDAVRDWCWEMLSAANADDAGGCPLCQA